jgi:CO dehydrogenase nickel-insertion accessory protein CooC1
MNAGENPATSHLENPDLVAIANNFYDKARIRGVLTVLNKIQDPDMEKFMRFELLNRGIEPLCAIHTDREISGSWLKGTPLESWSCKMEVHKIVIGLEAIEELKDSELASI